MSKRTPPLDAPVACSVCGAPTRSRLGICKGSPECRKAYLREYWKLKLSGYHRKRAEEFRRVYPRKPRLKCIVCKAPIYRGKYCGAACRGKARRAAAKALDNREFRAEQAHLHTLYGFRRGSKIFS